MVKYIVAGRLSQRIDRARRRPFERLVARAINALPSQVASALDNVEIVVQSEPGLGQVAGSDEPLFGLYDGVPLTERDSGYSLVVPDKITIFQGPLEREFPDRGDLVRQVQVTVLHELAHHLGMDEDRLDELGLS